MAGRLRKLALGGGVTLVFFAALEGGLRLAFPLVRTATLPETVIRDHLAATAFRYDPDLYWTWKELPGPGQPALGQMQINTFGFRRVQPMTVDKPPGVTRVFTFGDSQTLGAGVDHDATYSAVAEGALGPGWEVINAGISGYRSLNVLRLLKLRVARFSPDVVVVDCMPFDSPRDDGPLVGRPEGDLALRLRAAAFESRTLRLLRLATDKVRPDRPRWLDQDPAAVTRGRPGLGNHDLIVAWAREVGATPLFMTYPASTEAGELVCLTDPAELPPGVGVVDACGALRAAGRPAGALFQDRNHLTEEGNRVVGEALAQALRALTGPAATGPAG